MPDLAPLHVLVVDDERYARERLHDLLGDRDEVEAVDDADSGAAAVEALRTTAYDLVFLDVQMPERTGLEVVEAIGPAHMPPTIFVTAYDEYALKAFDLAALDYLLKPFDNDRFEQAFERALEMTKLRAAEAVTDRFRRLLDASDEAGTDAPPADGTDADSATPLKRLTIDLPGKVRVVPVEEIRFVTAEDAYVKVHTDEDAYLLRERMHVLEERLPDPAFVRIHRSTIVRVALIESVLHRSGGDYAVRLRDGTRLAVSRGRRDDLLAHLEEGAA
jgi:two-component system LytT family response regulator